MALKYFNIILKKEEEGSDKGIILLKIISIVIFLGITTLFGIMPYFIKKCRTSTKFLSISNAFSGGLFLGIGLFHLLPESAEMLEKLSKAPIAYYFSFISYALILFVEKVAFNSHALLHSHEENDRFTLSKLYESSEIESKNDDNLNDEEKEKNEQKEPMIKDGIIGKERKEENKENDEKAHENEHHLEHTNKSSSITPYILLLALGFHGFFEGMALGIQSDIQNILSLFLAIVAHKWAASLTLGISFVKAGVEKKQLIIMVLIFAFIGPLGVAFGLILSEETNETAQGIFLAISVGTFVYISCSEVLVEEFENPDNKYIKYIMFLLGGIFIAGLSLLELLLDIGE